MPQNDEVRGGVGAWVGRWWRALFSETLSTALLVLLGSATLVAPAGTPLTHPALAFGFVVMINGVAFGPASGALMNPSVTLAGLIYGALTWGVALAYCVAQVVGSIIGLGVLMALVPDMSDYAGCTVTRLAPGAAAALEALMTGTFVLLVAGVLADHDAANPDRTVPIKTGLGIAGIIYVGGPLTGASLNPARSFAGAVLLGCWKNQWVYWVGPLGGAALAAALHRWVLTPPRAAPPAPRAGAEPEALPLQHKV